MLNNDAFYMREALKQAELAFDDGEIPVGAVIVCEGQIISRAYNQVEKLRDPTAHAEMIAITSASNFLSSKYLEECVMYVTLEPCSMCRGALKEAHIKRVVFGAYDNSNNGTTASIEMTGGVMGNECETLINDFFRKLRLQ